MEGFVLSSAGAGAGLVLTWWTISSLKRLGPARLPRLEAIALEPRVAIFALAVAVVTTVLFALAPAIHAARGGTAAALRPGRVATRDRSRRLGQRVLVVGQLAVSVILLAGAALLVRSIVNLVWTDIGFNSAGVMLTPLPLRSERYDTQERIVACYSALLERLAATPQLRKPRLYGAHYRPFCAITRDLLARNRSGVGSCAAARPSWRHGRLALDVEATVTPCWWC